MILAAPTSATRVPRLRITQSGAAIGPGDEGSLTYANVRRRLEAARARLGVRRILAVTTELGARGDTAGALALGARAYDLVIDGSEAGGGSIRIHRSDRQQRMFSLLGLKPDDVERRFGWFVRALEYGAPPHGGIALGVDRIVAILAGESSIREVIAFPKTANALDLMAGAPSPVDAGQLQELHLKPQP